MNPDKNSFTESGPSRPLQLKRGQESVWDYPRPPRLERSSRHLEVFYNGRIIADTKRAYRILETSHPPVYYFPPQDIDTRFFHPSPGTSYCEWKGQASYVAVSFGGKCTDHAAWTYENPKDPYQDIAGYYAFYPGLMDRCLVDGEVVKAQAGDFYGGWITRDIVGPFKGGPGSRRW